MQTIKFTITGNQENDRGNPIPYTRSTQGGQFKANVRRYNAWKEHVRGAFIARCVDEKLLTHRDFKDFLYVLPNGKPIRYDGRKARMDMQIYFSNKAHADSDNVFKGIADALFENDKYLSGSFDFSYAQCAKVEVVIHFEQ